MMKLYTRRRGLLILNIYKKWRKNGKMDLELIIEISNGNENLKNRVKVK